MFESTPTLAGFEDEAGDLGPYGSWPYVERRAGLDRRSTGTRLFSQFLLKGRRAAGRRLGEAHNIYVDVYHPRDLALAVGILILNILDAFLTLVYVGDDLQREANPFARYLIELGIGWFIFGKAVVVAMCILFLVAHKTFKYVRPALLCLFAFYSVLLGYHLYLMFGLQSPTAH